jgi:RNA-binding protein
MSLTGKQIRYLRGLGHSRKPIVTVGAAGISEAVIAELEQALEHHELLKVKLPAGERAERQSMLEQLCAATGAEPVQQIGRVALLYRASSEPEIQLPQ